MKQLVRLRIRPSRDGKTFVYLLDYVDENGKRRRTSLGHADKRKAERQRAQKERELRMGIVAPESMKLSEFLEDSLSRTRGQVRQSTLYHHELAMRQLIGFVSDLDYLGIRQAHGERFVQALLYGGNSPATVNKKMRNIKRLFQLAVERGQLEKNPFVYIRRLPVPQRKIRVYTDKECSRLLQAAQTLSHAEGMNWELLIAAALCTGMRRGELLNIVWSDVDFDEQTIDVSPKKDAERIWEWHIKDAERRTLPLTDEVVSLLAEQQARQPEWYPYVFVPPARHDTIQERRHSGDWTVQKGTCPINNFNRQFGIILARAGVEHGEFHDLRRTCLTRWFRNGLSEYDVMYLAGHSDFSTTHRFYLVVREDLVAKARRASATAMSGNFGARLAHAHNFRQKGLTGDTGRRYGITT